MQKYVLKTLVPEDQEIVYNDEEFGMGSITGLSKWVDATMESSSDPVNTEAGKAIVAYF